MIIADQFPCRRTLLTNMTTETAWTAGRSQTTVLPKGFGLKSKSYQYQQSQIQHLLLQPVPPLSVINKLSFSSMKGSLSDNPLLHSSPPTRKVHTVRNGFTYQSLERKIAPIMRKKASSHTDRHGEELPNLLTRFLQDNYRGKLQSTHNFDLLLTRNLTIGTQSFNHAF